MNYKLALLIFISAILGIRAQTALSEDICSDGSLYHSHPSDCQKYIQCFNGVPLEFICSQDLLWNSKKEFCDKSENVVCNFKNSASPAKRPSTDYEAEIIASIQCAGVTGIVYFPHPTSCDQYFQCDSGIAVLFTCSNGLHFNRISNTCDLPSNANCDARPTPGTRPPPCASTTPCPPCPPENTPCPTTTPCPPCPPTTTPCRPPPTTACPPPPPTTPCRPPPTTPCPPCPPTTPCRPPPTTPCPPPPPPPPTTPCPPPPPPPPTTPCPPPPPPPPPTTPCPPCPPTTPCPPPQPTPCPPQPTPCPPPQPTPCPPQPTPCPPPQPTPCPPQPTPCPPPQPTPCPPQTTPCPPCPPTPCPPCPPINDNICSGGDRYYPNYYDQSKFIICTNGTPMEMECPSDLLWNQKSKTCDWPHNIYN